MLLLGVFFALLTLSFWAYCLIDAALTPAWVCYGLSKPAWILFIGIVIPVGAVAWLVAGPSSRTGLASRLPGHRAAGPWTEPRLGPDEALRRHPAGRDRPAAPDEPGAGKPSGGVTRYRGPDDDPEFLRELGRRLHDGREAGNEA